MMTKKGSIRQFEEVKKTYDLRNQDFSRYLQLRDYYNKKINILTSTQPIIKTIIQAYKKNIPKAISVIYDHL